MEKRKVFEVRSNFYNDVLGAWCLAHGRLTVGSILTRTVKASLLRMWTMTAT